MAKKVVGLDNLKVIKSYIDRVRGEVSSELDSATKEYLEEQLGIASEAISKDYNDKYKELTDKIAYVEQFGNKEELNALQLQLDALVNNTNDKFSALDSLEEDIKRLNGDYDDLNIKYNSIFSPGQLDEVIRTALISETVITDEMVSTPNLFSTKVVALIANMGHINAGSIDAGTIKGSSIESGNTIIDDGTDTGEPVWKIGNEGDGWLARKNIQWDSNGNVTFGPDVKIGWDSVVGGDEKVRKIAGEYDQEVRDYIDNFVSVSLNGTASLEELQKARADAEDAVKNLNELLSGKIDENKEELQGAIDDVNNWIEIEYVAEQTSLKEYYDGVTAALEQAYKDGDAEMIAKLEEMQRELDWEMEKMHAEYHDVKSAVSTINADVENLKESALTKYDVEDLLAASLIDHTEWDENHIATPSLLAKKIVGLVGTFGLIRTSKLIGTTIQGYTVSAPDEVRDEDGNIVYTDTYEYEVDENGNKVQATDENGKPIFDEYGDPVYVLATEPDEDGNMVPKREPAKKPDSDIPWMLKSDGTGWIADHMISWSYEVDENGNYKLDSDGNKIPIVNIDPDVKFSWEQIKNAPDGSFKFKSTAFKRTNVDISTTIPKGGDYDNPTPTGWFDGIPSGDEQLWATTATVEYGMSTINWSSPKPMTDTADFEVIYSSKTSPATPSNDFYRDSDGGIVNWLKNNTDWTDDPVANNSIWMATNKAKNGTWNGWQVSKIKGEDGSSGTSGSNGEDGRGILDTTVEYATSSNGASAPTNSADWTDTIPTVSEGGYLWTRTIITYTDNTTSTSYSVSKFGTKGDKGDKGDTGETGPGGANGRGISETTVKYAVTTNLSRPSDTSSVWQDTMPTVNPGEYLWTQVKYIYTSGDPTYSYSMTRMGIDGDFDNANLATILGDFKITSNTISAKTFSSSDSVLLAKDTNYYAVLEDGTFDNNLHTPGADGNPQNVLTADGSSDYGPAWQIAWNGNGYFAKGNINWDTDGNMNIAGGVNGGEVKIGSGVGVGPWNTFNNGSVNYIGDGESFDNSTNVFGSNGTFKIGGTNGIVKSSQGGTISLGSAVEFGGSGEGSETEDTWKFEGNISGTDMIAIYIGGPYTFKFDYDGSTKTGYLWVDSEIYNTIDISNLDNSLVNLKTAYYTTTSPNSSLDSFSIASSITSYDASIKTFTYSSPHGGTISACYFGTNSGLTKGDLEEWWGSTMIDGGKITTGKISANVIDVDNLKIKQLDTMELSDYSSGKYNGKSGTITVSGDTIRVYDSVNFNAKNQPEILRITGTPLDDTLPTAKTVSISAINKNTATTSTSYIFDKRYTLSSLLNDPNIFDDNGSCTVYNITNDSTKGDYVEVYLYKKIENGISIGDSEDITDGFDFYNKTSSISKKLNFGVGIDRSGMGGMPSDAAKITFYDFSYIASGEILFFNTSQSVTDYKTPFVPTTNTGYVFDGNGSRTSMFTYNGTVDSTDISATSINLDSNNLKSYICYTEEREFSDGKKVVEVKNEIRTGVVSYDDKSYGTCVPAGTYDVYVRAKIKFLSDSAENASNKAFYQIMFLGDSDDSHTDAYRSYMYHSNFDCEKYVPSCMDISSHGVKFNASNTKYVTLAKDGSFILKNGNYAVIVSDNGLAMGFGDGKYYKVERDSNGNLKANIQFTL